MVSASGCPEKGHVDGYTFRVSHYHALNGVLAAPWAFLGDMAVSDGEVACSFTFPIGQAVANPGQRALSRKL